MYFILIKQSDGTITLDEKEKKKDVYDLIMNKGGRIGLCVIKGKCLLRLSGASIKKIDMKTFKKIIKKNQKRG